MITTPTFIFYLSDIIQSCPLHTHNIILFLVSSWKQTFSVCIVVLVAHRTWVNSYLAFSSLWVRHSMCITSTFRNCYDDSLHLRIIKLFSGAVAGEQSRGVDILVCACFLSSLSRFCFSFLFLFSCGWNIQFFKRMKIQKNYLPLMPKKVFQKEKWLESYALKKWGSTLSTCVHAHGKNVEFFMEVSL